MSTSEIIESIVYTYKTTGTRETETRLDGNVRTFFYDANDRVEQVINSQLPAQNELFDYDLMGNWTTNSRQHNSENELTQDSDYEYEYDALGNMTVRQSLSDPSDRTTYVWDARNLLIAVNGPSSNISYAYDARNRRVAKTVDGATTQYVHNGLNVLLEYDGDGNLLARNTHAGLDQLCVRDEVAASTPYYICQDGINSVLSVSDDNGNILQRYRYSAFGEQQVLDANFNPVVEAPLIPFAYTGREWEPEVGMYFYRARFYDPELGRFISRDPIGLNGGDVNFYAYVLNSPINYWDPDGKVLLRLAISKVIYDSTRIDKDTHYSRNQHQDGKLPSNPFSATEAGWDGTVAADYHQQGNYTDGRDASKNQKFVSPDGKMEAVYDENGDLVTDPVNQGTYNFGPPSKMYNHFHTTGQNCE